MKKVALITIVVLLLLPVFAGCSSDDSTAPVITDVTVSDITTSSAVITWTTDDTATSQVEYGTTISYGSSTTLDATLVETHSVTLTGLTANAEHHYLVKSTDDSNNETISEDYTFTTSAIIATLPSRPIGTVNYSTADITVAGADVVSYKYKLDGGSWRPETEVSTNITLSDLADGPHTVSVIGKDSAGNWQEESSAITVGWTVDTTPPVAVLFGRPIGTVNYTSADITVAGADVVSYKYNLDGGIWSAETEVSTHITLSDLADGPHTVSVIGKDSAGNWQEESSATTASWTVDTTPPVAILSGLPPDPTSGTSADITVAGADVISYKYKFDTGGWSAERSVSTHIYLYGLADGLHTLSAIGKDSVGNWQIISSATTASWTVDTIPPVAEISGQPTGTVNYDTADITVAGTDVVSYKYQLDSGSWSAETQVSTHITLSGLADGLHTISVIGKDTAGNWQTEASANTASWTVDTIPPVATLLNLPTNPTSDTTTDITVAGTDVVSYKYQLDSGGWSAETSVSTHIILSELGIGMHEVSVIGKDTAGNWQEESSATYASWEVVII